MSSNFAISPTLFSHHEHHNVALRPRKWQQRCRGWPVAFCHWPSPLTCSESKASVVNLDLVVSMSRSFHFMIYMSKATTCARAGYAPKHSSERGESWMK